MKRIARVLGPILMVAGLGACGASTTQANDARTHCQAGGTECRWDNQCCSGRCYVDTGCSG